VYRPSENSADELIDRSQDGISMKPR